MSSKSQKRRLPFIYEDPTQYFRDVLSLCPISNVQAQTNFYIRGNFLSTEFFCFAVVLKSFESTDLYTFHYNNMGIYLWNTILET